MIDLGFHNELQDFAINKFIIQKAISKQRLQRSSNDYIVQHDMRNQNEIIQYTPNIYANNIKIKEKAGKFNLYVFIISAVIN